jgi:hypothetical protein
MEDVITVRKWLPACVCSKCKAKRSKQGFWATVIETVAGDVIDDRPGALPALCHECEMKRIHAARRRELAAAVPVAAEGTLFDQLETAGGSRRNGKAPKKG